MKRKICIFAVLVSSLCGSGWAQSAEQLQTMMKTLPEPAQQVIDRLGQLNRLAAGGWRVHPGDFPHGESPELDDSAWPVAALNGEFSSGAVWFRQRLQVPKTLHGYDLTGAKIWFSFQSRTTGRDQVTEIVYLDGRRVAMGEGLA